MRTLRVAKETSKYFDSSATTVLPRRSTRSSLARFAYRSSGADDANNHADNAPAAEVTLGSDIEDAVTTAVTRKRKRTETVTHPAPRRATATRATKTEIKPNIKPEIKAELDLDAATETKAARPPPRGRVRKPARKTTDAATGAVTVEPPADWEEVYDLVKAMRLTGPAAHAAVDTMGCDRLARADASARDRRFQTLVALMLSSQTKDTVNAEAMARLHAELPPHKPGAPPGLNLENMLAVEPARLNELIGKVGFHNNKTRYLKQTAARLRDEFASDIPHTVEALCSLPGVGPKMAHLCMSAENGWDSVQGVGVDVHVHRITNLWGWHGTPSKTPEETRRALESWLPRDRWKEINWLLVGFGQTVCLPVGRKCGECELGLRGLCRAAEKGKVSEGRKRRGLVVKKEKEEEVKVKVEGDEVMVKKEVEEGETEAVVEERRERDVVVNEEPLVEAPLGSLIVKAEET
ncbi:DNA glycosylase [Parathielavia hyrcaniae]|uniref:Endonuclease III homolog n=1 Tax=Parathielavia hyrcaniae TaxID=113614 RepID=A0AAN6T3V1_9PEZI|nr:DNA glycosylase [Parathielavia hyrcaniae]